MLVHGLAGSPRWWHATEDALRARHVVHSVDLSGGRFDLAHAPGAVVEALERVGCANLVGHSLGGLIAARVAARRPELVDRLVLVAPVGAIPPTPLAVHGLRLARTLVRVRPTFAAAVAADALRWGPLALWRTARALLADDVLPDLRAVRAPTLLVWGERDRLVPAALAQLYADALVDARIEVVRGAHHVPMVERPREFASLLEEFLG